MTDHQRSNPETGDTASSDEYGFDERHNPLEKDEAQAEAAQYGIYGYEGEAGQEVENQEPIYQSEEARAEPPAPTEEEGSTTKRAQGGQDWNESEHGAGFDQPLQEPQRSASASRIPKGKEGT